MKINWKGLLFWSNQFYGICAVLLAMESCYKIIHALPSIPVLVLIHLSTVIYYSHAYLMEKEEGIYNDRSFWYTKNKKLIYLSQSIFTSICIFIGIVFFNFSVLINKIDIKLLVIFSITIAFCVLYYLPSIFPHKKIIIRNYGILKSISIAWVWSVTCCVVPIWLSADYNLIASYPLFYFHLIELFILILILAILFDIKDIGRDQVEAVNTIVVRIGKNSVVNTVIVPFLLLYSILILVDWKILQESNLFLLIHFLLILFIYTVSKVVMSVRSIFMNILLIDGLMIIKVILSSLILWK